MLHRKQRISKKRETLEKNSTKREEKREGHNIAHKNQKKKRLKHTQIPNSSTGSNEKERDTRKRKKIERKKERERERERHTRTEQLHRQPSGLVDSP